MVRSRSANMMLIGAFSTIELTRLMLASACLRFVTSEANLMTFTGRRLSASRMGL